MDRREDEGEDINQVRGRPNTASKIDLLFLISRKCAEGGAASSSSRVRGSTGPPMAAQHTTTLARHNQRVMAVP